MTRGSHPTRARHYLREGLQPRPSRPVSGSRERAISPTQPAFSRMGSIAIVGYIKQAGAQYPARSNESPSTAILAFVHVRYLDWGGKETAGVDIFRFDENGQSCRALGRAAARTSLLEQRQTRCF